MKRIKLLLLGATALSTMSLCAQDWAGMPVPADAGSGNTWRLQQEVSDDFNYVFEPSNSPNGTYFGDNNKWFNFYHNRWDGPGTTYWKFDHVSVDDGNLELRSSRWDKQNQTNPPYPYPGATEEYKMGRPNNGVNAGCITSGNKVQYPVYVESAISVINSELASCFWLLSRDDTQEIDIIENYGGVPWFKQFTHISHHSFIRSPFHDYQPRDVHSWWPDSRVNGAYGWGDWAWNNGNRRYLILGVYWISPNHFEYYIDGELVRVMYHNAIATKYNGTWQYIYYNNTYAPGTVIGGNNVGGQPTSTGGYTDYTTYTSGSTYSFATLQAASTASNGINVIDPGSYQGGTGFTKEMDIIINVESQSWLVAGGHTPSDATLANDAKNRMLVDWVRVYKPIDNASYVALTGVSITEQQVDISVGQNSTLTTSVSPNNATDDYIIYYSSDPSTVRVDQNGVVYGISNGTATITATSIDGNFTDTVTVNVSGTASTPEYENAKFQIWPNPANDQITISLEGGIANDAKVNIYNTTGALVAKQALESQVIDISYLAQGTYIIQISSDNKLYTNRFIKQ